jgi:prepilin-type processing-associated H-X9-DG protein
MKRRRGFTVADIVVTTACMALVVMTLGVAGEQGRNRAKEAVCLTNVRQLSQAWLQFAEDHDGNLVGGNTYVDQWVDRPQPFYMLAEQKEAIRRGLLFPYVGKVEMYHCPADPRRQDSLSMAYLTFSIAGGANGEMWSGYTRARRLSDLANPPRQYVFVEEADTRGANIGSWQMNPGLKTWVDPLAMWHPQRTTLGFADGHAEMHQWQNRSLIEWCHQAMYEPGKFTFNMTPPADEQEDVEYMAEGFPCKSIP